MFQEVTVVVNGRYLPDKVVVRQNIPVRLNFIREEENPCSEWLIFPAFNVRRRLAPHKATPVAILPTEVGEFPFTCQLGLYRGKLVVRDGHGKKG